MLPFHGFLRGVIQSTTPTDLYESVIRYYIYHIEHNNNVPKLKSNHYGIVKSREIIPVITLDDNNKTIMTDLHGTLKQSTNEIFDFLFFNDSKSRSNALKKLQSFGLLEFFRPIERKYGMTYYIKVIDDLNVLADLAKQNNAPYDRIKWFEKAAECKIVSITDLVTLIENPQKLHIKCNNEEKPKTIESEQSTAMQLCEYFQAKYKEVYSVVTKVGSKSDVKIFNDLLHDYDFDVICKVIDMFINDYGKICRSVDYPNPTIFGLGKSFIFNKILSRIQETEETKYREFELKAWRSQTKDEEGDFFEGLK